MEKLIDIIFGNIQYNIAVSCPPDILEEFNNGSTARIPTAPLSPLPPISKQLTFYVALKNFDNFLYGTRITWFVGIPFIVLLLIINKKRWIESEIVCLFTSHYLRYLLLHSLLLLVVTIYGKIWSDILQNGTETWCTQIYPNYTVKFIKDPSHMDAYPRLYSCLYSMSLLFGTLIYPIMAAQLVLHRLCTYMALVYPFTFNQYFTPKKVCYYYNGIVINLNEKLEKTKISIDEAVSAIIAAINIFLTVMSVYAIIKYRKQGKAELKQLKYFFGFSVFPLIILITEKIFKIGELLQAIMIMSFENNIHLNETFDDIPLAFHVFLRYFNLRLCCVIVHSIECGLLALAFLNIAYFAYLLLQRKTLHANFRILCFNECLGSSVIIVIRYIMVLENLFPSIKNHISPEIFKNIYCLRDGMLQFAMINLAAILLERWWSTLCASHYETYFKPCHIILMTSISWITSLTIAIVMQYLPYKTYGIIVGCLNVIFVTGFILLFVYNKRLLKQNEYKTLTHGFQVRENVRTIKLMSVLSILVVLHFFVATIIYFLAYRYEHNPRKANRYIFWKGIFNAFFVTRCLILPNTVVFLFFRKRRNIIKCVSEWNYAVTDQSALYFTELRRQWGIKI